jgi:alpha-1,6-mannosyltransferase
MKSIHLTNAWHEESGGIATFYRALMRAAENAGHELRLIVPADATRVEEVSPHVRIYHLEARRAPLNRGYRWLLPARYLPRRSELRRILQQERPDLVEICDKYTLQYLAGLVRRNWFFSDAQRPTLVGLSCERMIDNLVVYLPRFPLAERFCRLYMKWLYFPLFDHHIAVSSFVGEELRAASRGHLVQRGVWIRGMGVDVERFHPSRRDPLLRRRTLALAGGSEDSFLLLYAGRLAPEKNLELLVRVMQRLAACRDFDFRLAIAGDGILREKLRALAARLCPGRVAWLGHVGDRNELAALYASADAFLHPNASEPFGIAPLEAMASELPLVAPNRGGILAYASEENAWLADPTPKAMARAVVDMALHRMERMTRAMAARITAGRRAWPIVAAEYLRIYEEMHAWQVDRRVEPRIRPDFVSTAGNWLGREVRST